MRICHDSDAPGVSGSGPVTPIVSQLVLSLFPGIDLLGRGFEREGFCVVRGPDLIHDMDICDFHTLPGRFDGVIGGSPCQDFSALRRTAPTGNGLAMLHEYQRVVLEAKPVWWLLENVARVPDLFIDGYSHQRIDINASECGLKQNRLRHFQFGHALGHVIVPVRLPPVADVGPCCTATEGEVITRRGWSEFCALQGLERSLSLDQFTLSGRYRAVGNGVPVPMAAILAKAIAAASPMVGFRLCECKCGRPVTGLRKLATAGCRKRMQRRRESVTDLVASIPGRSL